MIRSIRVKNFKSLKDVSLDLGLRNVLVGPNMSGKSNLIDVFRFLLDVLFPTQPGVTGLRYALGRMGGFSEVAWKGGDAGLISIAMEGEHRPHDGSEKPDVWKYEIEFSGDPYGNVAVENEILAVTGSAGTYNLIDKDKAERLRVVRKSDGTIIARVSELARPALQSDIPGWEGNVLVREPLASWRFYHFIPSLIKVQENKAVAVSFLKEHGDNLSSWLMTLQTRHPQSFAKIESVARDVFPEIKSLFTSPTQQGTVYVAATEKHLNRPVSIWQMADGQLAFIALLSLVYAPAELGASLYCVEEPENYLHPRLIETLIELVKQVQDELGPERSAQIVFTTHSPHLIDKVSLDELIVVERREGATYFTRPSGKQHLRDLLMQEEVGLGELYYTGALSSA
jgi:predicted ATPase